MSGIHQHVWQTARLCARAAICGALATHGTHMADARVAKAQRSMAKAFHINALLGNAADLLRSELARKRHAANAELSAKRHASRVVYVSLRRHMALHLGPRTSNLRQKPPVLDNEGIGT